MEVRWGWVMLATLTMLAGEVGCGREKRLLWVTTDGRLALPPGTLLTITPTISLPFVRYPPDGFLSNMTISLPFTINFDVLGLTDNQNPYGVLPPVLGRSAGAFLADYVASLVNSRRARSPPPTKGVFHGGERALLYIVAEDFLANFGLDGKACLLRAICEIHGHSLKHFGFFGEIIKLFFTASKSPYADLIPDYVEAEKQGRGGECFRYFKKCPKSLFLPPERNKYTNEDIDQENNVEEEITAETEPEHQRFKDGSSEITLTNDILTNIVM